MVLVVVLPYYVCYQRDNPTHPRRNFHLLNNFLLTTSDLRADVVDISMKQIESYLLDSPSKKKTSYLAKKKKKKRRKKQDVKGFF